jgi:hypothetical protein
MSINVHKLVKAAQYDGSNGAAIAGELRKPFTVTENGDLEIEGLVAKPTEWYVWSIMPAREGGGLVTSFEDMPIPANVFPLKYGNAVPVTP